ncbi:hypothetical protein [Streptomyces sp. NPDC088923]
MNSGEVIALAGLTVNAISALIMVKDRKRKPKRKRKKGRHRKE